MAGLVAVAMAPGSPADLARDSPGRASGTGRRHLLGALDARGFFTPVALEEPLAHPSEEPGRQRAVGDRCGVACADGPKIGTGPQEFVRFRDHDPGPVDIESKALVGLRWDLDGIGWIRRRAVCYGQDQHLHSPSSSVTAMIMAQGRSFAPSSRPSSCSRL